MTEKTAIITGGTGALGRVVTDNLSGKNIKVYIPALSMKEFSEVFDRSDKADSEEFKLKKIFSFECDVTDEKSVTEFVRNVAVQEKGKIDYLINIAGGIDNPCMIAELKTDSLLKMMNLNFMSAFYFSREVLKHMTENKFGRIISVGSKSATELTPSRFAYSYSKLGVIELMKTISEEYMQHNIRCNTIIPGIIDTPANREWGTEENIRDWTSPEDIAEIIYDLISDKFRSLRGSELKLYNSIK
ncbi:MAG: SDR family oxidoreductase [Bacteroidetes bacterium]|nr:SDR family oxidoreductase [Bacteroidota bacterium]